MAECDVNAVLWQLYGCALGYVIISGRILDTTCPHCGHAMATGACLSVIELCLVNCFWR
jgi:hypothetical protein